jgi:hypothetical protein
VTRFASLGRLRHGPVAGRALLALAILVAALGPALAPLARSGMPATHDAHLHLQRIIALDRLAAEGAPFSRWLPDLAYGYGLPVFNYYAPLVYAPALTARLVGAAYVDAYKLTAALSLVASAAAMFLLARSIFGPIAALTAGLFYAYLPYQLHNLYTRGALAELAAFAWLPVAAWCLVRLHADGRARWTVGLTLSAAGLVLTHNVTALIATPALAGLTAPLALGRRGVVPGGWRRFVARSAAGFGLGIGLAAWFWVPAIFERQLVQIGAMLDPALFDSFVLRTWPPFQLGLAYDYRHPSSDALGVPIPWPQVGLVQLVVSALGAVACLRARGAIRAVAAWAAALAAAAWALQFGFAAPLYDLVPLAAFIQFPWRLLVLVGLGSALLAAVLVDAVGRRPAASAAAGCLIVGALGWTSLARLAPEYEFPDDRFLTTETLIRADQADYGLGTTHSGEYLPVTTNQRRSTRFWKELRDADAPSSHGPEQMPVSFRVEALDRNATRLRATVSAPDADRLFVHQFDYPGWTARLNGAPIPIQAAGRFGIMAIDVPPGVHELEISFEWTPLRLAGVAVTALATVLLAASLLAPGWRATTFARRRALLARAGPAALAVGGAAWLATGLGASAAQTQPSSGREVDGQLALLGSRLDGSRLAGGGPLAVRLDWLALATPRDGYDGVVRIEAVDGTAHEAIWAYGPLMRSWERGELVGTETNLRLPDGFPSGSARVSLRLDGRDGKRPPDREPLALGEVVVPARGSPTSEERFAVQLGVEVTPGVELASYELGSEAGAWARPPRLGEPLDVRLAWLVHAKPRRELVAVVHLEGPGGRLASRPHTIGSWFNPPAGWQVGDSFRQQIRVLIPADLPPGSYAATLRVYSGDPTWIGLAPHSEFSLRPRGGPASEIRLGQVTIQP